MHVGILIRKTELLRGKYVHIFWRSVKVSLRLLVIEEPGFLLPYCSLVLRSRFPIPELPLIVPTQDHSHRLGLRPGA